MTETDASLALPTEVTDVEGRRYRLGKVLGRGGQGVVVRTDLPDMAVKLALHQESHRLVDSRRDPLVAAYKSIRHLPLQKLPIALPKALLDRPYTGFVMPLLRDMLPLAEINRCPEGTQQIQHYVATGGARRRMLLLSKIAGVIAELHTRALVYGDINDRNIFVSAGAEHSEVWLIDADNLHYANSIRLGIYTPGYGAPEVVTGFSGVDILTDRWAFAVLAFQLLLRGQHPFCGEAVQEAGWDDDTPYEERQELAYKGRYPYVMHPTDDSNRMNPKEVQFAHAVLTPGLRRLFERCFVEGKDQPLERPSLLEWQEALLRAHDVHVVCGDCGFSYPMSTSECASCGAEQPTSLLVEVFRDLAASDFPEGTLDVDSSNRAEFEEAWEVWRAVLPLNRDQMVDVPGRLLFPDKSDHSTAIRVSGADRGKLRALDIRGNRAIYRLSGKDFVRLSGDYSSPAEQHLFVVPESSDSAPKSTPRQLIRIGLFRGASQ
jgi:DNA-binding helix-hairpin-helix protein with protein kinase domain